MATVLANPNWPAVAVEADFTGGPPTVPGYNRLSLNAAYRNLSVPSFATQRGRQYELDKVSAGTLHVDVRDPYERLNPDNPASPYTTGQNKVTPYRAIWVWAMWPNQPGSGNVINTKTNNTYDPSFELNPFGLLGQWIAAGGTTTLARSTAQHFDGTQSLLVTQSAAGPGFGAVNNFATVPGLTYTFSAYVYLTAQTGLSVTIRVVDANGVTHSSSSVTTQGSWQRLQVTWTAVDTLESITIYGSGTTTPTFHADATQLEFGAGVTAFTTTGPILYPLFTGYVERWPTTYDSVGFRAVRPFEAVDALAVMARIAISQSYNATIAADTPQTYLPWSATTPATTIALSLASDKDNSGVAPLVQGNPNYFVPSSGQLSWGGDTHLDGAPALSVSQQNSNNPSGPGGTNQDTGADILNAALSFDTINGGMIEFWAKPVVGMVSMGGCYSAAPGLQTNFAANLPMIVVESSASNGSLVMLYNPDGLTAYGYVINPPVPHGVYPDNKWHYFAVTITNGVMVVTFDGSDSGNITVTSPGRIGFTYISHISANCGYGAPHSQVSYGRWAFYNTALTNAQRVAHYNRGVGFINETTGARVNRLLGQYWPGGPAIVTPGSLLLAPDFNYDPYTAPGGSPQSRFLLDVLQEITESERGLVYANTSGTMVFEDRGSRYTNQVPVRVFGEQELPYTNYAADFDPTYVFTQANVTRFDGTTYPPIINTAAQTAYGQRILTQTVQCNTQFDLLQAGVFYTTRYGTPKTRIKTLTLDPSANPSLWPAVLGLEISQRVTVKRRNAGLTVSNDYYVENIKHRVDGDNGAWTTDVELSPVFVPTAWILGDATYGILGSTTAPIY